MLKTQTLSLPTAKQLLMSCNDVEDSVPISTGEAAPTGSFPHSEPIVSTVRHVTGTGTGLLGGIPSVRHMTGWDKDYVRKIPRVVW
jgi:hypothetical protein